MDVSVRSDPTWVHQATVILVSREMHEMYYNLFEIPHLRIKYMLILFCHDQKLQPKPLHFDLVSHLVAFQYVTVWCSEVQAETLRFLEWPLCFKKYV